MLKMALLLKAPLKRYRLKELKLLRQKRNPVVLVVFQPRKFYNVG
jgi:hypothetical protein